MLEALESSETLTLPDSQVVVAGDWHGSTGWITQAIPAAARTGVKTVVHVGDFGLWPRQSAALLDAVDSWAEISRRHPTRPGIERVLVSPGNHEDYFELDRLFAEAPGCAVRVSETVWVLPRGYRMTVGGRSVMGFGGAASIDFRHRVPGREWWASELPTEAEVEAAVAGGQVEILITHDVGDLHAPRVDRILNGPSPWTVFELGYAAVSRARITELVNGVTPTLQFHGHYHVRDSAVLPREGHTPLHVESLAMNGYPGNLVLLELETLAVTDIEVPR
ncbi:metallophosphoesterase family protein [Microbacterium sp. CJ88]|uniref:metallophosphoesterase family protein n=1 Tax=Microbacterium sp. CJ88 TaxID=3445672 RepID=UPI003F65E354